MREKVYVFEYGKNPSSDYYVIPAFSSQGFNIVRVDAREKEFPKPEEGSYICVVRYFNRNLIRYVKAYKSRFKKLIYFMDDGLWDIKSLLSVQRIYGFRLFKKAYIYKYFALKENFEVWVSTDYLERKYKKYNPKVVYPYPTEIEENEKVSHNNNVVFFHGTASHKEEFIWLSELFKEISNDLLIEIFLDDKNFKMFKGIKNLIAIRPISWESYLKFSKLKYRSVGLVPLFENEFNKGRSWIKFYDITRSGAVGIYSDKVPYANLIKAFKAGIVLPMEKKSWIDALREVLSSENLRKELFSGAINLVKYLRDEALKSYERALG